MGYSNSIKTLENRLPLLVSLAEGKECEWDCTPGKEEILARQIREALYIAATIGANKYPNLARAQSMFRLIKGMGKVVAVIKPTFSEPRPLGERSAGGVLNGLVSVTQIIATIKQHGAVRFPDATLSDTDLRVLNSWVRSKNYLLFWSDPGVTIKPHSEELEEVAFNEEDLNDSS